MGTEHVTVADAQGGVVADVLLPNPKTLSADATVAAVRELFARKPSVRNVLLVDGTAFRADLTRADLPAEAADDEPALRYARAAEVVRPDLPVAAALERLAQLDEPRLIVVDDDGVTLRGLVCLSGGGTQFCVA
jgi:CBS domain-containing protein